MRRALAVAACLAIACVMAVGASTAPVATKPRPATAKKAIALVRAHRDTDKAASPFKREIRWTAEWRGDRWWVLGLFESDWGVRFVVDAAIWHGRVYTYINYGGTRPSRKWVRGKATRWGLKSLYTRLTPAVAIELAKESDPYEQAAGRRLSSYTILDAVARLAKDNSVSQAWYFAFYAQRPDGSRAVLAVTGLRGRPAEEGLYGINDEYGFGATTEVYERVPLNLSDWVRAVARARGWQASNLP